MSVLRGIALTFSQCSHNVLPMSKPRRKAQVRAFAEARFAPFQTPRPKPAPPQARPLLGPRDWRAVFIDALADGKTIVAAAKIAGVSRSFAYNARANDSFRQAWDEAVWFTRRRWTGWYEPRFVQVIRAVRR